MSGMTVANRDAQDTQVRRMREEYEKKQGELVKNHRREIARLSQQQANQLAQAESNHRVRFNDLQEQSKVAINDRDRYYMNQIADIRAKGDAKNFETRQLLQEDKERSIQSLKDSAAKKEQILLMQKDNSQQNLRSELDHLNEVYAYNTQTQREESKKSTEQRMAQLKEIKNREIASLIDHRDDKVDELERKNQFTKLNADTQLKSEKRRLENAIYRNNSKSNEIILNERMTQAELMSEKDKGYKENLNEIQKKYHKAQIDSSLNGQQAFENFKATADDRYYSRLKALEARIQKLKSEFASEKIKMKDQNNDYSKNLINSYEQKIAQYEANRADLKQAYQDRQGLKIREVIDQKDGVFKQQFREFKEQQQLESTINRQALREQRGYYTDKENQIKGSADERVQKMTDLTHKQAADLETYYKKQIESREEHHAASLAQFRDTAYEQQRIATDTVKRTAMERERQLTAKNKYLKEIYSQQMADLESKHMNQLKSLEESQGRRIEELTKTRDLEIKTQRSGYEEKIANLVREHKIALERNEARHQEQTRKLIMAQEQQRLG